MEEIPESATPAGWQGLKSGTFCTALRGLSTGAPSTKDLTSTWPARSWATKICSLERKDNMNNSLRYAESLFFTHPARRRGVLVDMQAAGWEQGKGGDDSTSPSAPAAPSPVALPGQPTHTCASGFVAVLPAEQHSSSAWAAVLVQRASVCQRAYSWLTAFSWYALGREETCTFWL